MDSISRYWRGFLAYARYLRQIIGCALGRAPPGESAAGLWRRLLAKYRSLAHATRQLASGFKVTCFGKYVCHSPAAQVA